MGVKTDSFIQDLNRHYDQSAHASIYAIQTKFWSKDCPPFLDVMSRVAETMARSPFSGNSGYHGGQRHIPILPSSTTSTNFSQSDTMEITSPASTVMGPPVNSSPEMEHEGANNMGTQAETGNITNGVNGGNLNAAAVASSQQPKVVQTAFIHKLYKSGLVHRPVKLN